MFRITSLDCRTESIEPLKSGIEISTREPTLNWASHQLICGTLCLLVAKSGAPFPEEQNQKTCPIHQYVVAFLDPV